MSDPLRIWYRPDDHSFWRHDPGGTAWEVSALVVETLDAQLAAGNIPRYESGEWVIYTPAQPPPDVLMHGLKRDRNRLLKNSDWTQMPDSPLSALEKAEWASYRQTLRDLPQNYPQGNALWPTQPT